MPSDLTLIKEINAETKKKLSKINITNIDTLRKATKTHEARKSLANKINVSIEKLYTWSKLVELMRVEGVSSDNADFLVNAGIRDINDLKAIDAKKFLHFINTVLVKLVDIKEIPSIEKLNLWKNNAESVDSEYQKDDTDVKNEYIFLDKDAGTHSNERLVKESGFFSDLSEVIIDIGRGIAGAQHQLDLSSIEIQNTILENNNLETYGLNATWYTIPEVNFNLKMEYMMMEESTKTSSGPSLDSGPSRKLLISPSNAKYNNLFKSQKSEESSLDLKFVPIPPPEKFTERIIMPDLIGMSKEEAEAELAMKRISIQNIAFTNGKTDNDKDSEVIYQSIEPGKVMLINEMPELKIILNS